MIHEPNTKLWQPGALVLHDADAKKPEMLMRVSGYDAKTGLCKTRYIRPSYYFSMGRRVMHNPFEKLHDPARFGIALPDEEVKHG